MGKHTETRRNYLSILVGAHTDPARLRTPLMRKKSCGKEECVEAAWDEAPGFIAERMQKIKTAYGPESVALFSHGIGRNFLKMP